MSNLTRYDFVDLPFEREPSFEPCENGAYVKFDDIKEFLPTGAQQAKENIKPSCLTCVWHLSGSEACGECVDFSWWQRV